MKDYIDSILRSAEPESRLHLPHRKFKLKLGHLLPISILTLASSVLVGCDDPAQNTSSRLVLPDSPSKIDRELNDLESLPADRRDMVKDRIASQIRAGGTPEQIERYAKITGSSIRFASP